MSSSGRRPSPSSHTLPPASPRRLLARALPALLVAAGALGFQIVRSDRGERPSAPTLSAAERSTRALLNERTSLHLRALRPR